MQSRRLHVWQYMLVTVGTIGLVGLIAPRLASAGGVHLSIGFDVPVPVAVVPAPVIVHQPPVVIAQPPPVVVHQPPVYVEEPPVVYRHDLPPGLAKQYYGYQRVRGHGFYKPWKHRHHHHHDYHR